MNRIKKFILGGIVVENYSHSSVSSKRNINIYLYIHWRYRFLRVVNSTRYMATYVYRDMDWFVTDWESIIFVKDSVFDDPLPSSITGRIFEGEQRYLYYELYKL